MTPPADTTTDDAPDSPSDSPVDEGHVHDVLIVGGGPSGSSCAYWLAEAGWDVATVPATESLPVVQTPLLMVREIPGFWVYWARSQARALVRGAS